MKVASGAAEQCGRAVVPVIAPTVALAQFMADPPAGLRLLLLERDEGQPPLTALPRPEAVTVQGSAGSNTTRSASAPASTRPLRGASPKMRAEFSAQRP